ncbi:hypothetical protein HOLleu_14220 [Holothuria leucospilota]|uniref:C2H2-type domain-containing protein n=1 Tax=Holothuria leucospilota TaxID=206669 RepID=A0A9Q1HBJ2_HOLLE|nr:hypothetical protein HOLleu_14220 [Holothuria leucospilota]
MKPLSNAWNNSKRYSGLVDAKKNDVRIDNPDAHYYCARTRYRLEFAMEFEESIILSADCMNKINVGGLAVSRYHQVNKIFPTDDAPNLPDHDFPMGSNYKLTPSGYLQLNRDKSKPKVTKDKLGRDIFPAPRSGPAFVFNRAASFRSVSSNLTAEERRTKEAIVFDSAMGRLSEYWHGAQFDSHPVTVYSEKCTEVDRPFNDYIDVHGALKTATRKKLKGTNDALQAEIDFLARHSDRRIGELTMLKCEDTNCDHCSGSVPSSALLKVRLHGGMPTPVTDTSICKEGDSHYFTYSQAIRRQFQPPDEEMVIFQLKELGKCDVKGCRYVFASKKDLAQHSKLFH